MKNFGTLFGYELKKIWTRPMTWAAVLVFCAAFVWITVQPFFRSGGATFTATDANGSEISRFLTAGEQYRLRTGSGLTGRAISTSSTPVTGTSTLSSANGWTTRRSITIPPTRMEWNWRGSG